MRWRRLGDGSRPCQRRFGLLRARRRHQKFDAGQWLRIGTGSRHGRLEFGEAVRAQRKSLGGCTEVEDRERGCDGVDAGQRASCGAGGLTDLLAAELVGRAESDGENAGDRQFARCRDTSELLGLARGADGDEAVEDLGEYVFGDDAFAECDFGGAVRTDVRPTTSISARLATVPARTRSGPNDRAVRVLKVSPVR